MPYDPQLALECAKLSTAVYYPDAKASVLDDPHGHFIDIGGTQALMINKSDCILIVFRGTTYEDIHTDFKCLMKETPQGAIHRGFLAYARAAFLQIANQLQRWERKPLIFTGHSLGAAAAVITAAHFYETGHDIDAVYTFGCPRVGNAEFKGYATAAFGKNHFRHVNGHDGVPMLPPWIMGYRHCGQRFYFSTTKQRLIRNGALFQIVLERLPLLFFRPCRWARSKRIDHAVFLYESACQRNLGDQPE